MPADSERQNYNNMRRVFLKCLGFTAITAACSGIPPITNPGRVRATSEALAADPTLAAETLSKIPQSLMEASVRIDAENGFVGSGLIWEEIGDRIIFVCAKHVIGPDFTGSIALSQPQYDNYATHVFLPEDISQRIYEDENELAVFVLKKKKPDKLTHFISSNYGTLAPQDGDILFSLSYPVDAQGLGWFPSILIATDRIVEIKGMKNLIITRGENWKGSSGAAVADQDGAIIGFIMAGDLILKQVEILPVFPYAGNLMNKVSNP